MLDSDVLVTNGRCFAGYVLGLRRRRLNERYCSLLPVEVASKPVSIGFRSFARFEGYDHKPSREVSLFLRQLVRADGAPSAVCACLFELTISLGDQLAVSENSFHGCCLAAGFSAP